MNGCGADPIYIGGVFRKGPFTQRSSSGFVAGACEGYAHGQARSNLLDDGQRHWKFPEVPAHRCSPVLTCPEERGCRGAILEHVVHDSCSPPVPPLMTHESEGRDAETPQRLLDFVASSCPPESMHPLIQGGKLLVKVDGE